MSETNGTPRGQDRDFAELKREIIESRNLIIKTDNLLKNLQAELKNVAKKGAEQYSRTWLATGVAYAIFAVMAIAIGVLAARVAVGTERARGDQLAIEQAEAKKIATDAKAALEREKKSTQDRQTASAQALKVFKQLSNDKMDVRLKGLDASVKLDQSLLSELERAALDDRSRILRKEAAEAALDKAKSAFRRQDMKAAIASFERYFSFKPEGKEVLNAHFLAGAAYFEEKAFAKAVPHLESFVAGGKTQRNHDYGSALLGQSLEKIGDKTKAIAAYEKGLLDHPSNSVMRNRLNSLKKSARDATAPAATPTAPAATPPVAPPAGN